jgi:hypothetical protein
MKGPLRTFLEDVVTRRDFLECPLIDAPQTAAAVQHVIHAPAAKFLDGERAWTMLAPYLWERAVIRGHGAPG